MSVVTPALATAPEEPFGPARIAHWSSEADLQLLGTYSMVFDHSGESDPWTLSYEESLYVIEGTAWVTEFEGGAQRTVRADTGHLIVIGKGATVRYGGEAGTRLLLSIAPVNWQH